MKVGAKGVEVEVGILDYGVVELMEMENVGEQVVHEMFLATAKSKVQAVIRKAIKEGKEVAEIQGIVNEWYPGKVYPKAKRDPKAEFLNKCHKVATEGTEEEKQALRKMLAALEV